MRFSPRHRLLSAALSTAFGTVFVGWSGVAQAQPATQASAVFNIDVPAQSLASALNELSRQTGMQVFAAGDVVAGVRAPALSGRFTLQQALDRLLAGSGLVAARSGASQVTVQRQPAVSSDRATLPQVNVTAQGSADGTTEGSGSYTTRVTGAGTRMDLSLRETPQSVSVITRQQIEDQNLVSLNDVLRQTPGIVADRQDERVNYSSRGFDLSPMIDGIPTLAFNSVAGESSMISTAIYDRVEVIRGAAGLLNGVGSPGGSINLVRKRPTPEFSGYVSGGFGSWNRYNTEADLGGKLNTSGTVRGRVVASHSDGNNFTDYKKRREDLFYGIVEIDVAPSTTVALGYEHQKNAIKGANFGQTPLFYADGSRTRLPVSFNSSAPWSTWDMTTDRFFLNFEHRLDNGWRVKAEGAFAKNRRERAGGDLWLYPSNFDPVTQQGELDRGYNPAEGRNKSFDLYATGPFELFGRRHQASFGMNVNRYTYSVFSANSTPDAADRVPVSLYDIGASPRPDFIYPSLRFGEQTEQRAIYGSTRLRPTDDLSVIIGGRVTWYRNKGYSTNWAQGYANTTYSPQARQNGVFTPYFGVVYDVSKEFSVYASYTDIFQPNTAKDVNNNVLDPKRGHNVEVGVKGEHMDGKLNTSFAVFRTQEDNLAVNIDGAEPLADGTIPSRAVKGARSKGFEATVSGELARGWQIMGGYTHYAKRDANDVLLNTSLPRRLLRISTSYRLPGEWSKLTIGGSVSYQSGIYYNEAYGLGTATQGGITLLGLMARYDFTKQLSASLNIENLSNKRYYSGLGGYNGYTQGTPRSAWAKVTYKF
ncbi:MULTISPECIES: TonB-dependent siderophore receptor [unclassified Variovorax]|uniref:TonB-dependent siderophore receptor n=1 Tax=unclassified Variovorax TaxID=663243 RepID=UPI000D1263C7|nr:MULTISPECIES: TonB-dependent receptor [unclassified Variovorax]AVQ84858.1 TonB-dependent siderophore receptor [Variovorax sp. PMC12]QRY35381.1 TonB-dependent siderophore receptor [Variovorax sp. PDNC026]